MKSNELTPQEKVVLRGYVHGEQSGEMLDVVFKLSRNRPTRSTDPVVVRKMSLRWLNSEPVQNYLLNELHCDKQRESNNFKTYIPMTDMLGEW